MSVHKINFIFKFDVKLTFKIMYKTNKNFAIQSVKVETDFYLESETAQFRCVDVYKLPNLLHPYSIKLFFHSYNNSNKMKALFNGRHITKVAGFIQSSKFFTKNIPVCFQLYISKHSKLSAL